MEQRYGRNSYSKCVHMLTRVKEVEKLVLRYVCTKWMAPNKCYRIFFCALVQPGILGHHQQGKCSWFSSIIITIILPYAIIRIYTILHNYLQVSETEGLAELHWVIGMSVLEKINSIYFQGSAFRNVLSRIWMCFQKSECS